MQSQQSRVLVQLRDLILKGAFVPGERLAEIPISERLEASRTPVRLALVTLEQEGLVQSVPNGGYVMRSFTRKEIDDGIAVRGVLEGMAARLVAEMGISPELHAQLSDCISLGDRALAPSELTIDAYADYVEMNDQFHALILKAADNAALTRAIELNNRLPFASASATLPMHASTGDGRYWLMITHSQHRSLLHAIERKEGARAQAIANEHVEVARMNLRHAYEKLQENTGLMPALRLLTG